MSNEIFLYTADSHILAFSMNGRNFSRPVVLRSDYLKKLTRLHTGEAVYYMYENLQNQLCVCSVGSSDTYISPQPATADCCLAQLGGAPCLIIYGNDTVSLEFPLHPWSNRSYISREAYEKLKDSHKAALNNAITQYNELSELALGLQQEGRRWREKCFRR